MAPNSLFPSSVQLFYRSANAPHIMTIPLREWSPISSGHPAGTTKTWEDDQTDTDDMIVNLIDKLLPFFDAATGFSHYIINTYADANAPARPQVSTTLTGKIGTDSSTIPATQATFNFKTTGFGAFKLVMVDCRVSATFNPVSVLSSPTYDDEAALVDVLKDTGNGFSGRDGNRPSTFTQITYTLNEKLRKSYRLD